MGFSQGYGPAEDDESVRAIHRALGLGVTMLDTAMSYGSGHNERLVAQALAAQPSAARTQVQVATKFGIVRGDAGVRLDGRPEHVAGYCDSSLDRLGMDVIDLYYLHRADPEVPIEETVGAMAQLVAAGKVRHLGLSEVTPDQLRSAAAVHPISAVQFEWSMLWREPEDDIVPAARSLGVGLVPYSPLGRGLLTATLSAAELDSSDFRRSDPRFHAGDLTANLAQVEALRAQADALGITPGQLALAWLLAQGDDVVPIPGTRRSERIGQNVRAADVSLTADQLRQLDDALPRGGWSGERRSFAVPTTSRAHA